MSDLWPIHTLRTRCAVHGIDTTWSFPLADDPEEAFEQLEAHVRKVWPKQHHCRHRIRCTRLTEDDFMYDPKTKEAVEL